MAALAASARPLTREALSSMTGLKESTLCARLYELRPIWIEQREGAGRAASGFAVDAYALTSVGQDRWAEANRPLALPFEAA